ncbi:MAG: outer-membrane lipoprotein carrier protein LolA [Micavibrio aeruginosavorus]|uniref:Outer-membrane lipoprotein carrier protein LolA n=1 Tax=Micavibrio aeruginosavorus TaxID=349221 RepID=A0A7T5R2E4_9BACT|nr:MAG: outer-membrane lipoprotein carrier protein LolA [Micavibrio aeruginosavorus]
MKHLILALALLCFPFPATAQTPVENPAAVTAQVEGYLQNLKTAKARFLQTAGDGSQAIGTFYLSRPGKLRFEYDPPIKDYVVADGYFIYFYDGQLQEQSNAPIGQTMADFLLRPDLKLKGDVSVTKVERGGELTMVSLAQASDPAAGTLTLAFSEEPFALKKWRVTDAQGAITEVELFQLQTGVNLPSSLFVYTDPKKLEGRRFND